MTPVVSSRRRPGIQEEPMTTHVRADVRGDALDRPTDFHVDDDPALLDRMMRELVAAPELYRPTNYWAHYEKSFLPELKRKGLHDFRRRRDSVLDSFGAADLPVEARVRLGRGFRGAGKLNRLLRGVFEALSPHLLLDMTYVTPRGITEYFRSYVGQKMSRAGLDIAACPTTRFGNPADLHEIQGGFWTLLHLDYCAMLADAAPHIALPPNGIVCELGSGLGRNVEIIGRLFPEMTILSFDIPPQLYVAQQYLTKVFGSRLVPYDTAVKIDPTSPDAAARYKGKVLMLPAWRMPAWADTKIDLFWNSASFQEMEPDVVTNYLSLVKRMRADFIYINAHPKGQYWGEVKEGKGGTRQPVLAHYYYDALAQAYDCTATYDTDYLLGRVTGFKSFVFKRK